MCKKETIGRCMVTSSHPTLYQPVFLGNTQIRFNQQIKNSSIKFDKLHIESKSFLRMAKTEAAILVAKEKQTEKRERLPRKRLAASRLTQDEEKDKIYICQHLFQCLVLLRRKLIEYLNSWKIDVCPDDDVSAWKN